MSALDSGKTKLSGVISFDDLPKDRNSNLWTEIRTECRLSLGELSALQNAVCSSGQASASQVALAPTELAEAVAETVLAKLEERKKAKEDITVVISKASQNKVETLFKTVGIQCVIFDGPDIPAPTSNFNVFDWGNRDEAAGLPDAKSHIETELRKFGVTIGRDGYQVVDVHKQKNLLNFKNEKVGSISGGSDVLVVPNLTGKFSFNSNICVLFELKTNAKIIESGFDDGEIKSQALVELLAARCLSNQPEVMVILTDLVSGAIIYTINHSNDPSSIPFFAVEHKVGLDAMGAIVAQFLTNRAVSKVGYVPNEANDRDIPVLQFKKTKLSHDVGLALEHFNDMVEDTEPNSRERAGLVEQLFRSMEEPQMSSLVYHSMYS